MPACQRAFTMLRSGDARAEPRQRAALASPLPSNRANRYHALFAVGAGDVVVSKLVQEAGDGNIDAIYYRDGASLPTAGYLIRKAREEMFSLFMTECKPTSSTTVLDLGVSDEENSEANILEKQYPLKTNLPAPDWAMASLSSPHIPALNTSRFLPAGHCRLSTAHSILFIPMPCWNT